MLFIRIVIQQSPSRDASFTNTVVILFGSDYGSAPTTTSDIETDYTNSYSYRSTDSNTGTTFFSTQRCEN
jgi:hypothetical protein